MSHQHKSFAANQSPVNQQTHMADVADVADVADLEARLRTAESRASDIECKRTRLCAELAEAQGHLATLVDAFSSAQTHHSLALAVALASAQSEPDRWRTATQQVISSASDIIGTNTATQLLERIRDQVTALGGASPTQLPVDLTGSTMYIGRGAPRRSDYRKTNDDLLKPCVCPSQESGKLYKLPDGSVHSLGSLSTM